MSVLDQVVEMKSRGVPENEIVASLREKGVSPGSIMEALNQARIKNAVSSEGMNEGDMEPSIMRPERAESLPTEGEISDVDLTPPSPLYQAPSQRGFFPMHHEVGEEEYFPGYNQGQESYSSQQYQPTEYEYPSQAASDTDTMIEISEQVFLEKIKPMQKQVEDFSEFKVLMQSKAENISERLKRIEASIDRLQAEILEKVGSYGRGLDSIQKEMSMMQDSFGKTLGSMAEKTHHKHHAQHPSHPTHRIEKKTTVVHKSSGAKKHSKKKR